MHNASVLLPPAFSAAGPDAQAGLSILTVHVLVDCDNITPRLLSGWCRLGDIELFGNAPGVAAWLKACNGARVEPVHIEVNDRPGRKNAGDFLLACRATELVERRITGRLVIASSDRGLDTVARRLRERDYAVWRVDNPQRCPL